MLNIKKPADMAGLYDQIEGLAQGNHFKSIAKNVSCEFGANSSSFLNLTDTLLHKIFCF